MLPQQYRTKSATARGNTRLMRMSSMVLLIVLLLGIAAPVLALKTDPEPKPSALQNALLDALGKKGFIHTPQGDGILLAPYTRGVESVDEFALYRPLGNDFSSAAEHVYVVESPRAEDQAFVIDGFQRVMATAKTFGADQKDAAILKIDDTVIYYQLQNDRALRKALRAHFGLTQKELGQTIVSDYGKHSEAIDPLVADDTVIKVQVEDPQGKQVKRVENEQKEFLFVTYHDLEGKPWFGTRLFSFRYATDPLQVILCIDPLHLSEKAGSVLQGSETMPLEEFVLFEGSDPILAQNVQRYALAGMTLLYQGEHILRADLSGLTLTPEGYRIYAAMSKLVIEEVMKTKVYQEDQGHFMDLSQSTYYSLPANLKDFGWGYQDFAETDLSEYRLDLEAEKQQIHTFLQELEKVPQDRVITVDKPIQKGDVFTYRTELSASEVELLTGADHPFLVEVLHNVITVTALEDLPVGESYTFTFVKKTGVAEENLLFSDGTAAGRPDFPTENNQGVILLGADRTALPQFRLTITSREEEEPVSSAPVSEPVSSTPVSEPVSSTPVSEPVSSAPVSEPVSSAPESEPVSSAPVSEPVSSVPESEPVSSTPIVSEPTGSVGVSVPVNSVLSQDTRGVFSEVSEQPKSSSGDPSLSGSSSSESSSQENSTLSKQTKGAYSEEGGASVSETSSSRRSIDSPNTSDGSAPMVMVFFSVLFLSSIAGTVAVYRRRRGEEE